MSAPAADSTIPATISGRVVNAVSGQPIARALVRFNDRAMLTNYEGKFEFDQVTDENSNLQASKPGYNASLEPGGSSGIILRTSQIKAPLELRLYPEAIFTGTVTAPDGDPLEHVLVSARRSMFLDGVGHLWLPTAQVQTDSQGRFRLPVAPGDYKLESSYVPQMNGTDQAILPVTLPSESSSNASGFIHIHSGEEQRFDLHPAVSRAYTVVATFDADVSRGFPQITAHSSNGGIIPLPVRTPRFNSEEAADSVRMELPSGTYTLTAKIRTADGIEEGDARVTVTDHDISGVVFHLMPVPSLPVELQLDEAATSDNTTPSLAQFGLTLENDGHDPDTSNSATSLSAQRGGGMSFTVSPGTYRLRARNNGSAWYVKSATYGGSDLLQQEIVVAPGAGGAPIRITASNQTGSLQGSCKLNSVPAVCWIYLIPTGSSATSVFATRANQQGVYNYSHLPPGSYQAVAFEQKHSVDYADPAALAPFSVHVHTITINAGEKPTLDLDTVPEAEMVP
jgi:hypothetical protein